MEIELHDLSIPYVYQFIISAVHFTVTANFVDFLGPVHMCLVWWEAHLSGMNYFYVHMIVFIPPNIPPQWYEIM